MRAVANLGTPRDAHVSLSRSLAFHHTPRLPFPSLTATNGHRETLSLSFFLSLSRRVSKSATRRGSMNLRAPIISTPPRASPTRDATRTRRARSRSPLALARARHPSSPSRTAHRSGRDRSNERTSPLSRFLVATDAMRCDAIRCARPRVRLSIDPAFDRSSRRRGVSRADDGPNASASMPRYHSARGAHPWGFRTSMYDVRDCVRSSLTIFHFPAFERVRRLSRFVVDATGGGWTGEDSREISTRW